VIEKGFGECAHVLIAEPLRNVGDRCVGAVVTRTQRPSGEFNARVKASIGSESLRQFNVMAEAPLGDSVSGLISINSKDADGYLKNTNTAVGDDIGGTDLMTTRGVLTFNPSEQLEVTAIASLYKSNAVARLLQRLFCRLIAPTLGRRNAPTFGPLGTTWMVTPIKKSRVSC
jgi:hypothetical protein